MFERRLKAKLKVRILSQGQNQIIMTELYSEKFIATVNEEAGEGGTVHREVILRGAKSAVNVVFRNQKNTEDIEDGMEVEMILRTIPAKRKTPTKAKTAKIAAKKPAKKPSAVGEREAELFVPKSTENVGKTENG